MGIWYVLTWTWNERHYYDTSFNGDYWETVDTVFIQESSSIKQYVSERRDTWVADGTVYEEEERGMPGYGVSCYLANITQLTPDGQKIELDRSFLC